MASLHLLRLLRHSERARRAVVLLGAAGIAVAGYAVVSTRGGGDGSSDEARTPDTSAPTVLGAVITPDDRLPTAPPASPVAVVLEVDDQGPGPAPTSAPSPAGPPTTSPPATSPPPAPSTTSTEPPPTLVPPTMIENTTTTTSPPSTTTTTEPEPEPEQAPEQP